MKARISSYPHSVIVWHIILLVLSLLTTNLVWANGDIPSCPCLTFDEKVQMSGGLIEETLLMNFTQRLTNGDITQETIDSYGVGCDNHLSTGDNYHWCFVDPNNCDLQFQSSYTIKSLYFSKAACGNPDEDIRNTRALAAVDLRCVLMDNHRGYQGTECYSEDKTNINACTGTVVELARNLLLEQTKQNITCNWVTVPTWIQQEAERYKPFLTAKENMTRASCVYATALGAVDVCFGAFTKNKDRALISSFLEMGVTSEYLVVYRDSSEQDAMAMIARIFSPFSWALWCTTFIVLIALSLLFVVQELDMVRMTETTIDQTLGLATYNAVLGFFAAGTETEKEPMTWGGRFTLLAIAVQILLTTASYTANLTNFLVRDGFDTVVDNIDEAIQQQVEICVLRNKIAILDATYGENKINYAINPETGRKGFEDRGELLKEMDNRTCQAAILGLEEILQYHGDGQHCDKQFVGTPVIELPWGIPVSEQFARPLRTIMTEYMQDGRWNEIQTEERPSSMCSEQEADAEETKLEIKHMAGAYVLSGILAAVGVVFSLTDRAKKQRKDPESKGMEDSERDEHHNLQDLRISAQDNTDLHSLVANLGKEILELKQIIVFNESTR